MNYAKINLFDIANGKGIRVSLFVSGCYFNCPGCFNKEAQDFKYGKEFGYKEVKLILDRLKDDNIQGLSILGGDPLCQSEDDIELLIALCRRVKEMGKDIWIWSGRTLDEVCDIQEFSMYRNLLAYCDVFVDGRFIQNQYHPAIPWRGSLNQRIIDLKESRMKGCLCLWHEKA